MPTPGATREAADRISRRAIPTRTRRAGETERKPTVNETTLDRLTKLSAQRSARLDSLREACVPLCELMAPLNQVESPYRVSTYHQHTNVGGCAWTMIDGGPDENWTIDRACGESGGWTHGDFNSPKPSGPTPRQLRDFAAWLADPATLRAIADLEQETAEAVDGLTAKLIDYAAALK